MTQKQNQTRKMSCLVLESYARCIGKQHISRGNIKTTISDQEKERLSNTLDA